MVSALSLHLLAKSFSKYDCRDAPVAGKDRPDSGSKDRSL